MTSANYRLFRRAILAGKQVSCVYNDCFRALCPHVLGHTNGREKVLAFQFGGESNSTLPPGGEWRCLDLAHVTQAEIRDGPWHEGAGHRRPQSCVKDVDLDINIDVRRTRSSRY